MAEVRTSSVLIERLPAKGFEILSTVQEGFMPRCDKSIVIVAKHDAVVVGRLLLVSPAHVEGAWIREDYRSGLLLKNMMDEMERQAKKEGLAKLMAYGNPINEDYLSRLGFLQRPVTVWEKKL